jgi:hypothetical protein
MPKLFKMFCFALALAVSCSAQVFTNLQKNADQIKFRVGPRLRGGIATPTSYSVSESTAPDGTSSLEFTRRVASTRTRSPTSATA